jgi:hypothetical protein
LHNASTGDKIADISTVVHTNAALQNAMLVETVLAALTSRDPTITYVSVRGNDVDARHENFVSELVARYGGTR